MAKGIPQIKKGGTHSFICANLSLGYGASGSGTSVPPMPILFLTFNY
jgi:FKBP-type peptidyl-prolyl cis-trans isomerase